MHVELTVSARRQFAKLPLPIQARVRQVLLRLREWPEVSGAKPMRGSLAGHYRIRTGDYRILFQVLADIIVVRIEHRSTVYEE